MTATSTRRLLGAIGLLLLLFPACGGSPAAAPAPRAAGDATPSDPPGAHRPTAPPRAPRPTCTDTDCFPCGDGFCPAGFYCDDAASGGPACEWVPGCAATATCECVGHALPGATCSATGGGAHVK